MSGPFTHLFIATAQSHTKLMLQFLEIGKLPPHIGQFFFQPAAHGRTRMQASPAQFQEAANLSQRESKVLHASDEPQCLNIAFVKLPETTLCSCSPRAQSVARVEPN